MVFEHDYIALLAVIDFVLANFDRDVGGKLSVNDENGVLGQHMVLGWAIGTDKLMFEVVTSRRQTFRECSLLDLGMKRDLRQTRNRGC